MWWQRRRIYYACMGKIVNLVTSVHLKHAYFHRIGSLIDLLKDAALTCHRTPKDREHVTEEYSQ